MNAFFSIKPSLFIILLLPMQLFCQLNWHFVEPGTPSSLYFASCKSGNKIFLVGTGSVLYTSSDMGNSWQDMSPGFCSMINYWPQDDLANIISFVSESIGFASDLHNVYKTTDGGKSWQKLNLNTFPWPINNIYFINEKIGLLGGYKTNWRTTDGGLTFTEMKGAGGYIRGFRSLDQNRIWLFSGFNYESNAQGGINYSSDGGKTWNEQPAPVPQGENLYYSVISMDMSASGIGVASVAGRVSALNSIIKYQIRTTDFGRSWNTISHIDCAFPGIVSISDSLWIMVGNDSWNNGGSTYKTQIYRSTDYGLTWKEIPFSKTKPAPVTVQLLEDKKTLIASGWYGAIYRSTDYGLSWSELSNVTPVLTDIEFGNNTSNTELGFGIGYDASVIKTIDGGRNWIQIKMDSLRGAMLTALKINNKDVWIGDYYGKVLRSRDEGKTWKWANTPFNMERGKYVPGTISDIQFSDSSTGAILTQINSWSDINPSYVFLTRDNGSSWKVISLPPKMWAYTISIINDSSFYVGGMASPPGISYGMGFIWRTTNSGASWDTNYVSGSVYKLQMKDTKNGIAGINGALVSTSDGGRTWKELYSNRWPVFGIVKENENSFWASEGSEILRSSDGGASWNVLGPHIPSIETIKAIAVSSSGKIFVSLEHGGFLTSAVPGITDVNSDKEKNREHLKISAYLLEQNYPNPFNPITNISYSIPEKSRVELKIFDTLGREISTLVNKEQSSGEYKIQFDGSSLSSGVYIYTIQAGSYRDSKKLIIVK